MERETAEQRVRDSLERLGRRLRRRRQELRLGTVDLGEQAGLSHSYISRLERGLVPRPTLAELECAARAYGYTSMSAMLADDATPVEDVVARVARESPRLAERLYRVIRAWDAANPTAQTFALSMLDAVASQLEVTQAGFPAPERPRG